MHWYLREVHRAFTERYTTAKQRRRILSIQTEKLVSALQIQLGFIRPDPEQEEIPVEALFDHGRPQLSDHIDDERDTHRAARYFRTVFATKEQAELASRLMNSRRRTRLESDPLA